MGKIKKISIPKVGNKFSSKKAIKAVIITFIIAVVVISGFGIYRYYSGKKTNTVVQSQRTAKVTRGDITVTVSGSGPIESAQSTSLTSTVASTITAVNFKDGDRVKKGDVIFELEDSDAKEKVESIKSQIDDVQSSISDVQDQIKNLTVTAPISGIIKSLNIQEGDRVSKGTTIANIVDTSTLKCTVSFPSAIFGKLKEGMKVLIYVQDLAQPVYGTITYIGNTVYTNEYGSRVFDTETQIKNPGALQEGMLANVQVTINGQDYMSIQSASLEYALKQQIKSQVDGEVESIYVKNNQFVEKGSVILKLENDDYQKQLKNYQQQLKNLQNQLKEAQDNLDNYRIKAPFDGIVTDINFKKGDNIKAGEVLATVFDDKNLVFRVDIDELDIAKIKVGQKVNITVDALQETQTNPLTGKVSKIPLEGSTQNGVTTYPVTISIDNPKNLKIGMNANAEIIVNQKQNVLMVPLEAVQKLGNRYFVFVKTSSSQDETQGENGAFFPGPSFESENSASNEQSSTNFPARRWQQEEGVQSQQGDQSQVQRRQAQSSSSAQGNFSGQRSRRFASLLQNSYYKGSVLRPVEVGINNDSYIEIVSGLNEGDIVVLPPLATSSSTTQTQNQQGFNIFGGFGGGPGGAPGEFRQYRQFNQNRSNSTGGSRSTGGSNTNR